MAKRLVTSLETTRTAVRANFLWLDRLSYFSASFFVTVVVAKLFDVESVEVLKVSVPLIYSIVVLCGITVSHFYISRMILVSLENGWRILAQDERRSIYEELVAAGGLLVRGVYSYEDAIFKEADGDVVFIYLETRADDPPVIFQTSLVFLAFLACVPFEISLLSFFCTIFVSGLISVNWQVGSNWIIGLVDFSRPKGDDFLFTDGYGPRSVSSISGFFLTEKSSWSKVIARSFVGSLWAGLFVASIFFSVALVFRWFFYRYWKEAMTRPASTPGSARPAPSHRRCATYCWHASGVTGGRFASHPVGPGAALRS